MNHALDLYRHVQSPDLSNITTEKKPWGQPEWPLWALRPIRSMCVPSVPMPLPALALSEELNSSVVTIQWLPSGPGNDCNGSVFGASGTLCQARACSSRDSCPLLAACLDLKNQSSPQWMSLTKLLSSDGSGASSNKRLSSHCSC